MHIYTNINTYFHKQIIINMYIYIIIHMYTQFLATCQHNFLQFKWTNTIISSKSTVKETITGCFSVATLGEIE